MAGFASSTTMGGARKHAWTKIKRGKKVNSVEFDAEGGCKAQFRFLLTGTFKSDPVPELKGKPEFRL